MGDIQEVHGFRFGSEVYPTREAAEAAQRFAAARDQQYKANLRLSDALACLIERNHWEGRAWGEVAEGICDDLFPVHRDRSSAGEEFMKAMDRAADAWEALSLSTPSPKSIEDR